MADNTPIQGQQQPTSAGSLFNAMDFICRQIIGRIATATLVQVKAVSNDGGVSPVGTVDVQPMVSQIDGAGNATPHGTIYGLPYFRLQGGANAVILDPQVGDIGIAVFASTDISSVKANKAPAAPGSRRTFDWADGLYLGGFLNGTPTQYVQFSSTGIAITSTAKITVTDGSGSTVVMNNDHTGTLTFSSGLDIKANTKIEGALEVTGAATLDTTLLVKGALTGQSTGDFSGEVTANGGHTVSAHTHTQPNDSHGDTEMPTNTPTG